MMESFVKSSIDTDFFMVLGEPPKRVGEMVLKFGVAGRVVGDWKTIEIPFGEKSIFCPALIERVQPDDGDGPGFTVFGLYDRYPWDSGKFCNIVSA